MWLSKIFLDSNFTSDTSGTTIIVGNAAGRSPCGVYIGTYMHLVKIGFFNVTTTYYNFINLYRFYTILKLTGRECFGY